MEATILTSSNGLTDLVKTGWSVEALPTIRSVYKDKIDVKKSWDLGFGSNWGLYSRVFDLYLQNNSEQRTPKNCNEEPDPEMLSFSKEIEKRDRRNFGQSKILYVLDGQVLVGGAWASQCLEKEVQKGGKLKVSQQVHIFVDKNYEGRHIGRSINEKIEQILNEDTNTVIVRMNRNYSSGAEAFKKLGFKVSYEKDRMGNVLCLLAERDVSAKN